jgi:hypothetical protein
MSQKIKRERRRAQEIGDALLWEETIYVEVSIVEILAEALRDQRSDIRVRSGKQDVPSI